MIEFLLDNAETILFIDKYFWWLYLASFILTYALIKWFRYRQDLNDWSDVTVNLTVAAFGFLGLLAFIVMSVPFIVFYFTDNYFDKLNKPPKWL